MWLVVAWACATTPAPVTPAAAPVAPAATPGAHEACVEDCVNHRQMAAEPIEHIRARCSDDCTAAHDPATLP